MNMFRQLGLTGLVLALAAVSVKADPPVIKVQEAPFKGNRGEFIAIKVETTGKAVRYVPLDSGLNVFPAGFLIDQTSTVVTANADGTYRLLAYTGTADGPSAPVVIKVVVGVGGDQGNEVVP